MLFVKTFVGQSVIEGVGLFADQFIAKGTITYRRDDRFAIYFTEAERLTFPEAARVFMARYAWRVALDRWCVSLDNSRFTNHSKTPNLFPHASVESPYECIAARDIYCGEELTEDYSVYDPDFKEYAHTLHEPTVPHVQSKRESGAW